MIAVQQILDLGVTDMRERYAIDDGLRGVVAAHRVDRNDDFAVHALAILSGGAGSTFANYAPGPAQALVSRLVLDDLATVEDGAKAVGSSA